MRVDLTFEIIDGPKDGFEGHGHFDLKEGDKVESVPVLVIDEHKYRVIKMDTLKRHAILKW